MTKTIMKRLAVSATVGTALAGLTFELERLSLISGNSFVGGIQHFLAILLLPGIFGAMAFGNNAHAFYLWLAAGINWLVYFAIAWVSLRLTARRLQTEA